MFEEFHQTHLQSKWFKNLNAYLYDKVSKPIHPSLADQAINKVPAVNNNEPSEVTRDEWSNQAHYWSGVLRVFINYPSCPASYVYCWGHLVKTRSSFIMIKAIILCTRDA